MKALILSCNTGEGHNAAGKAVYEKLLSHGVPCGFVDALSLAGKNVSQKVTRCYVGMTTKAPKVFQLLYAAGGKISRPDKKSIVYKVNEIYKERIYRYIMENGYDTIITPHLFPAQTVTSLKLEKKLDAALLAVATDYTCIPFWEDIEPEYFIIPHPALTLEFTSKGVPESILLPYGIPVREEFRKKVPQRQARQTLGIPQEKPAYLIMSGSMGFGNLGELIQAVLKKHGQAVTIIVLCGNNQKLMGKLQDVFSAYENVRLQGFTHQVGLFMNACDVVFTKPGGLTSTEAAVSNIPLIHTSPIPGCETKNAQFFSSCGMSFYSQDVHEQVEHAWMLVQDATAREEMLLAQRRNIPPDASDKIYTLLSTR